MTDATPPADRCTVEPSADQLAAVTGLPDDGPVIMLNLLRFRAEADYSADPALAPDATISGEAAYQRYGEAAMPHIAEAGASLTYLGSCHRTVIGPDGEQWDQIVLVRYPDPAAFLAMVTTEEYQALSGHRRAALADSRLVPTTETRLD